MEIGQNFEKDLKDKLNQLSFKKLTVRKPKVYYPAILEEKLGSPLKLLGYYSETSNSYNIVDFKPENETSDYQYPVFKEKGAVVIGMYFSENIVSGHDRDNNNAVFKSEAIREMIPAKAAEFNAFLAGHYIVGLRNNDKCEFYQIKSDKVIICDTEAYSLTLDVFSRNAGLLETSMMKNKTAIISGCGSVGSYVALELARSGVGNFVLIDNDTVSYANVCRHQCNISDVGFFKTEAVAQRISLINPEAIIHTENSIIENVPAETFSKYCTPDAIIIGCADNRQGDIYANKIATHYQIPMVSIGFWERAFAGEIFFWIPEKKEMACYHCFTDALGELSGRESANRRYYTTEDDLTNVTFMPGISVDITFITNIGVKITLDILNRNNKEYITKLIDSLTQFTLIANTNKTELGGEQASVFSYPLQVTTSIEVIKDISCPFCGIKK